MQIYGKNSCFPTQEAGILLAIPDLTLFAPESRGPRLLQSRHREDAVSVCGPTRLGFIRG